MLPKLDDGIVGEEVYWTCQAESRLENKSRRTCERWGAGDVMFSVTPAKWYPADTPVGFAIKTKRFRREEGGIDAQICTCQSIFGDRKRKVESFRDLPA